MSSGRPSRTIAIAVAMGVAVLTAGVVLARDVAAEGWWSLEGDGGAVTLTCAADGAGLALERRAADGAARRGRGALSARGWLCGRFEAAPGIASGAADPVLLARALDGPRAGFGLWELVGEPSAPHLVGFFTSPDGARRFERGGRNGVPADPHPTGGFVRHLREAIALNKARRDDYEARSGGEAAALSRRLVLLERLSIPWAWWVDVRAKRWNRRGVMIVAGDFVSMQNVRAADAPPTRTSRLSDEPAAALEARLAAYRREVKDAIDADRFDDAARLSRVLLGELEATEAATGCGLPMTRHCVEQVGFAALNALTWRAQSGGQTDGLARSFLRGLRFALKSSLGIDRRAQACHARGVAIIENDVPEIPLGASYDAWAERQRR